MGHPRLFQPAFRLGGEPFQVVTVRRMLLGEPEPAEPLVLIRPRPQGGIVCPQATHVIPRAPVVEGRLYGRCEGSRQGGCLLGDFGGRGRLARLLHGGEQLIEGLGEQLHPLIQQACW